MKRTLVLIYGIVGYALGSGSLAYLIAFLFNLVPISIDSGEAGNPFVAAIVDVGLILLFAVQHSVMARPGFKQIVARLLPKAAERSTYMIATGAVVFAMCLLWQPIPTVVWQAQNSLLSNALLAIGLGGWVLVLYSTFLISHFDLFGLRQVYLHFVERPYTPVPFKKNSLYRSIRHPIMTGVFVGIWFTPVMTVGHLVLSVTFSAYIVIGVYFEERDLIRSLGQRYTEYMQQTTKFFPVLMRRSKTTEVRSKA